MSLNSLTDCVCIVRDELYIIVNDKDVLIALRTVYV